MVLLQLVFGFVVECRLMSTHTLQRGLLIICYESDSDFRSPLPLLLNVGLDYFA